MSPRVAAGFRSSKGHAKSSTDPTRTSDATVLSLTLNARVNTLENKSNFMKIDCNPNQNVYLVYQLITFKANKS